jgi:hypothetical protein
LQFPALRQRAHPPAGVIAGTSFGPFYQVGAKRKSAYLLGGQKGLKNPTEN